MEITVSVENVDFSSIIGHRYDDEDDRVDATLGDKVAAELVTRAMRDTGYREFAKHIQDIRDEEIRVRVAAEIEQALTKPFQRTNPYGEPVGEPTTLREQIAEEARKALTEARTHNSYSMSDGAKKIAELIQREAAGAVRTLLKQEMDEETARLRETMRAKAVELIAGAEPKQ